ncbi:MAG: hypothetical protein KAV00_01840 [Phycisphaerae bacterium]|nr:hypothetical protein [Phycisphaerae bacterium]
MTGEVTVDFDTQSNRGWMWYRYDGLMRAPWRRYLWRRGSRYYPTGKAAQRIGDKAATKARREAKRVGA